MILLFPKEISKKLNKENEDVEKILEDYYGDILKLIDDKKISESDVKNILSNIAQGKSFDEAIKIEKKEVHEIEERVMKIIKEKPGLSDKAYMGIVMSEFKGAIDGKSAMEIIKKYL
jgi:Glu-tRNA(Gln) amidotransferase subunit E-like FAD-binding protein